MVKVSLGIATAAILSLGMGRAEAAMIYNEIGDAGQTLATAQLVNALAGGTALDAIRGNLEAGGADIFVIELTGGQTFSATTTASSLDYDQFDSQLFLFDSSGIGVYANDDDPNSPPQSTLPASISLTPSASGTYYLAISGTGYLPVSSGGYIFPVSAGFLDQIGGGATGAVGPTGPGGGSALSGFSSTSSENGAYEIQLTGAQFLATVTSTPEPGSFLLLGVGLCGFFGVRLMRTSRQS